MRPTEWDEPEFVASPSKGGAPPGDDGPGDKPKPRRWPRIGWLLSALFGTTTLTLAAVSLDHRTVERDRLAAARDEAAELRRSLFVAEDKLKEAELTQSQTSNLAAQMQTALVQHGAEQAQNDKLIQELRAQLDAKDGDVAREGGRISVSLVDEILFPSGEAELSPRGQEVLKKVGGVLKGLKDQQILVGGHTDDRPIHNGRFASNWELSTARAVNVVHYLAETVGVDPHALVAAGYSEFHPRSRDRARNRRIEILLTPVVEVKAK